MEKKGFNRGRRKFIGASAAGIAVGAAPVEAAFKFMNFRRRKGEKSQSRIKLAISHMAYPRVNEDMLTFMQQIGVDGIEGSVARGYESYEHIVKYKQQVENAGLELYNVSFADYNHNDMHLGLPGRDRIIDNFCDFIRNVGKAGIKTTGYAWTPGRVFRTGKTTTRGGCVTDEFDEEKHRLAPLVRERDYTDEELWENYKYFIERIVPVAEEARVQIQLHPGDPPIDFNIPRLFRSTASYDRMVQLSRNSPYSGIKFCVGTWAEMRGPDGKGEDVVAAIRKFGKSGKIFGVHFRNISSPLPYFHETFMDNGYLNMYLVMKALWESGYSGPAAPDHVPLVKDEKRLGTMGMSGTAFSIGYMRALLQALEEEIG